MKQVDLEPIFQERDRILKEIKLIENKLDLKKDDLISFNVGNYHNIKAGSIVQFDSLSYVLNDTGISLYICVKVFNKNDLPSKNITKMYISEDLIVYKLDIS